MTARRSYEGDVALAAPGPGGAEGSRPGPVGAGATGAGSGGAGVPSPDPGGAGPGAAAGVVSGLSTARPAGAGAAAGAGATALEALRVPDALSARVPAEQRGAGRDDVRLLVSRGRAVAHHAFRELPEQLRAGDVLVVNTSMTLPAAVNGRVGGEQVVVHFSTRGADGRWAVELRAPAGAGVTGPRPGGPAGAVVRLPGGRALVLEEPLGPAAGARLWWARVPERVPELLHRYGRPIRYGYTDRDQPLSAYRTVFAVPSPDGSGSAEMPSAARPFTVPMVAELLRRGVLFAPLSLHTGVASAEAHEPPYPERFAVPAATAWLVNAVREAGRGRVVAVGTTAVRALESAVGADGAVRPADGWTDLVVTPRRGVRAVDGLLTGLHEPRASHLLMLEAVAGREALRRGYEAALQERYLWHEFGDVHLILPDEERNAPNCSSNEW
ncbi:S-adenosylmethionine:tRNA ribosyltransferase-isomerase [Streptomyces sp. NPDC006785]|uniref:S-adenosylmethionine:tRNA ribosyltransferase-isomerase n=1 Tax=Streptomyces sp. NPDC006785 TaxID=3155461 RepID=UPI0033DFE24E